MRVPSPFLLNATPAGGVTILITSDPGGLNGYELTGQAGPPLTVKVNDQIVNYPVTLLTGDALGLERSDSSDLLSIIFAFAPVGETVAFEVTSDADGYQSIENSDADTDIDGYQTIPDATATIDADGYETVERSTS